MSITRRYFLLFVACSGFLWVMLGAMAGHHVFLALQAVYFEKAQRYQIIHTLALFILTALPYRLSARLYFWTGILWITGIVCFSGSLYIMALCATQKLRYIVPVGGTAFLFAWLLLACLIICGESHEGQR